MLAYHIRLSFPSGLCPQIVRLRCAHFAPLPRVLQAHPIHPSYWLCYQDFGITFLQPPFNCLSVWCEFSLQYHVLKHHQSSRFDVVTTVMLKIRVFWDVTPFRVIRLSKFRNIKVTSSLGSSSLGMPDPDSGITDSVKKYNSSLPIYINLLIILLISRNCLDITRNLLFYLFIRRVQNWLFYRYRHMYVISYTTGLQNCINHLCSFDRAS